MMRAIIFRAVEDPKTRKLRWQPFVLEASNRADLERLVAKCIAWRPQWGRHDA